MINNKRKEILHTFMEIRNLWLKKTLPELQKKHTTMLQFEGLSYIYNKQGCLVTELAENLGLSASSATQFIERLVQNNLVRREDDKDDRRFVHLYTTDKGNEELQTMQSEIENKFQVLFENISESDLETYLRVQKEIIHILNNHTKLCSQK